MTKAERIRESIAEDYDNDGFESYSQSLKVKKLQQGKKSDDMNYRMSKQIIQDFEENK